ncbi:MAG TPA: SDR family NAD(P)-dependent oxidoreductase [Candidatus Paceibacterota bacterium]|nr:SDR family NAD(P)-dependent oxidoreductase [Candidatus Paceibacterota bacterium]
MKTAVITGVSQGIGKALAQKFLAEGYQVIGTTTDGTASYTHPHLHIVQLDLRSPESITGAASAVLTTVNAIDVLINNAGVLLDEEETTINPQLLRDTLEVNVIGPADFTNRVKTAIVPGGHLINISSTAGSLTLANEHGSHYPHHYPAYKISKAAVNMATRTFAMELAGKATVSAVHPGWVRTAMGGDDADMSPEESAQDIFAFAISHPETGQFWFRGEKLPW